MISIKQRDTDSGELVTKSFPLIDVIPADIYFGITGLSQEFGDTGLYGVSGFFGETGPSGNISSYLWDFGDGNSSTDPDPSNTYNTYGYHKIFLKVKDATGTWFNITQPTGCHIILGKSDFSALPVKGDKPLLVEFEEDNVAPTGLQFTGLQWDFGDTFGTTGSSPAHIYLDYGSYSVRENVYLGDI